MKKNIFYLPEIADGEDKTSSLKNCIRKKYRHLRKWAKRTNTDCFRIYNRDIKAFPIVIDFYSGEFLVQVFSDFREDDEPRAELKLEVELILCSLFNTTNNYIHWRMRTKRTKLQQYEKIGREGEPIVVSEYGVKFKVNLADYLDSGIFLDHRETRQMVASLSKGKKMLNLFAYTCTFSVHAAIAGAAFTKSVDLSNTYTQWGKENFTLNDLPLNCNEVVRADCLKFVEMEHRRGETYDVIVIDPPTISRSKKMDQMFDIQLDYTTLLLKALLLLAPKGILFFSTNSRRFKFEEEGFENWVIKDISEKTLPYDFQNHKAHCCWTIEAKVKKKKVKQRTNDDNDHNDINDNNLWDINDRRCPFA